MPLKKLLKKAKNTVKKAKESAKAKGLDQFFKKEGGKYIPHGLKSEHGKIFPGQQKTFQVMRKLLHGPKKCINI